MIPKRLHADVLMRFLVFVYMTVNPVVSIAKSSSERLPQVKPGKAVIYLSNGDYADKVPVKMDIDKLRIIDYPSPSEVNDFTAPVILQQNYLLDLQGIDASTVFMDITRDAYGALGERPVKGFVYERIIPESGILEIIRLPFSTREAVADTAKVNALIKDGLKGCKVIYRKKQKNNDASSIGTMRF